MDIERECEGGRNVRREGEGRGGREERGKERRRDIGRQIQL